MYYWGGGGGDKICVVFFYWFIIIVFFGGGRVSLIICDELRYKNVDPPPPPPAPCKLKICFPSYVFCKGHYSWNFTHISLNRKEIQRVVLIPLMQKFLLRHIYIYLFLRQKRGIMKVTIYKGFT